MPKQLILCFIIVCLSLVGFAQAEGQLETDTDAEDEQVIAVLDILELMEIMDDITLLKDMEYLMEEDPNEPQK